MSTDIILRPDEAIAMPGIVFPALVQGGTNMPQRGLSFLNTALSAAFFDLHKMRYTTGSLTLTVDWAGTAGTTSGNLVLGGAIGAYVPGSGGGTGQLISTTFDTEATTTTAHLGTTGDRVMTTVITISALSNLTNGALALAWLRLRRSTGGSDTYGAAVKVMSGLVTYT